MLLPLCLQPLPKLFPVPYRLLPLWRHPLPKLFPVPYQLPANAFIDIIPRKAETRTTIRDFFILFTLSLLSIESVFLTELTVPIALFNVTVEERGLTSNFSSYTNIFVSPRSQQSRLTSQINQKTRPYGENLICRGEPTTANWGL